MGDVVSLADKKGDGGPWLNGEATCLACKAKWVVVAPVGTYNLECPQCSTTMGVLKHPVGTMDSEMIWICPCGSDVFQIVAGMDRKFKRMSCLKCGMKLPRLKKAYYKVQSGEWVQPKRRGYRMMCCDCGLVHILNFRTVKLGRGNKVQFQAFRHNRATASARANRPGRSPAAYKK